MALVSPYLFILPSLTLWADVVLLISLVSYGKLVVLSIGLRDGMRRGMKQNNPFADQCVNAASEALTHIMDKLSKLGCEISLASLCFNMWC